MSKRQKASKSENQSQKDPNFFTQTSSNDHDEVSHRSQNMTVLVSPGRRSCFDISVITSVFIKFAANSFITVVVTDVVHQTTQTEPIKVT